MSKAGQNGHQSLPLGELNVGLYLYLNILNIQLWLWSAPVLSLKQLFQRESSLAIHPPHPRHPPIAPG